MIYDPQPGDKIVIGYECLIVTNVTAMGAVEYDLFGTRVIGDKRQGWFKLQERICDARMWQYYKTMEGRLL